MDARLHRSESISGYRVAPQHRSGEFQTDKEYPMERRCVTIDVFTDRMFGGNPVAVVLDAAARSGY